MHEQNRYLVNEVRRLNESLRSLQAGDALVADMDRVQTRASFDYQWKEMPSGAGLPSDPSFALALGDTICGYTDLSPEWFAGKRVADVGCGLGRFTLGFLRFGAEVSAFDQSESALARVRSRCVEFGDRLQTDRIDLLQWDSFDSFDLVYCYGVVHHTGNTYLAIRNVARKVRPGGRLFLMVYGLPRDRVDLEELNRYEDLRQELRLMSFDDRAALLTDRYGEELAHGYFDAVSPKINDLLSFGEIGELLLSLGFENPRTTLHGRNIHLVADRIEDAQ